MRSNVSAPPAASKTVRASMGGPEGVPERGPETRPETVPESGWPDMPPFYATSDATKCEPQRRPTRPRRHAEHGRDDEVRIAVGVATTRAAERANAGDESERWCEGAEHGEDSRQARTAHEQGSAAGGVGGEQQGERDAGQGWVQGAGNAGEDALSVDGGRSGREVP